MPRREMCHVQTQVFEQLFSNAQKSEVLCSLYCSVSPCEKLLDNNISPVSQLARHTGIRPNCKKKGKSLLCYCALLLL